MKKKVPYHLSNSTATAGDENDFSGYMEKRVDIERAHRGERLLHTSLGSPGSLRPRDARESVTVTTTRREVPERSVCRSPVSVSGPAQRTGTHQVWYVLTSMSAYSSYTETRTSQGYLQAEFCESCHQHRDNIARHNTDEAIRVYCTSKSQFFVAYAYAVG
jgi:hypothetical protein